MAIRVVIGIQDKLALTGLAAVLAQADDIEVLAIARDKLTLGEMVRIHQPQVVVADAELIGDVSRVTWARLQTEFPQTALVLLDHSKQLLHRRHTLLEYTAGLILFEEATEMITEAVRVAAAGYVLLSRSTMAQLIQHLRDVHQTLVDPRLEKRDLDILGLVAQGRQDAQIAHALGVSERTIQNRLRQIYHKLGVETRVEAVVAAIRAGMLDD